MQITAQMVSQLREQTGAGMMECKKALTEAEGDIERARDILRAKGEASAVKRAGRAAADGAVAIAETDAAVALVELNSETDFVARNEEFRALAQEIADAAANNSHDSTDALREVSLAGGQTVGAKLGDALAKMRENIVLRRSARYEKSGNSVIGSYVHRVDNKTGVLVELSGDPNNAGLRDLAKSIAMHVAAAKPTYLKRDDVPATEVEREREVLVEKTRNEGKPDAAIPKIVEGRIGKFFETLCLVEQPYVREPSKKIGQLAQESGSEVLRFTLFLVGQE
jgi:elongation factor Ts